MDKANFPIEFNNEIDDVKKGENEQFQSTLDSALDGVERQVRERRKQQRNY